MDSAFRYGGEEFTIILPETTAEEAKNVAHRIKTAVEFEHFFPEPENVVRITISIGVTEYSNKEQLSAFIKRADQAMYLSKDKGRNTISFLFAENS
jgi:diguanylate cyclase (GGDEF)-like protein